MLPLRALAIAVLAAVLLAGCGGKSSSSGSVPADAAAKVGDQIVPKWRVDALLNEAKVSYQSQNKPFPAAGTPTYESLKQRATGFLVVGAMYIDRAARDGVTVSDADVTAAIAKDRNARYGGDPKKQAAAWLKQGTSPREAREEQRLQIVEQRVERKLLNHITISNADMQQFYDQNKTRFSVPESRAIRMILVRSMPLAQQVEAKLKGGADFKQLVKQYSQDPGTKSKEGALVVARGQGGQAFEDAVFGLQVGQISAPVKSPDGGIRIVTPLGPPKPARFTPLSEIRPVLRMQLVEQKRQSVVSQWQLGAKKEYCGHKITYAKGYKPTADTDPCGENRPVPATG